MLDSFCLPVLAAQTPSNFSDGLAKVLYFFGIIALVIVLPMVLGSMVAKSLRMRGYGWKISLIFLTLTVALLIVFRAYDFEQRRFHMPMGVDLKGGVVLIYEVDLGTAASGVQQDLQQPEINMGDLTQALTNRINPSGTKEIVIRPYGERQVEIIIPEVEAEEVEIIKRQISTAGMLEFRIVANERDHRDIIVLAEEQAQSPDAARRLSKNVVRRAVVDSAGREERVGFWAQAAKEKLRAAEIEGNMLRNSTTGEIIDRQKLTSIPNPTQSLEDFLAENGLQNIDFLVATNDGCNVTGDFLGMVSAGMDDYLSPCVNFRMQGEGVGKFQALTSSNLPDMDSTPPFYRHLGIILDERILSFPRLITTISDSGRITGNFKQEEVEFLVGILRAGKLPATLKKVPISENHIGSMLGDDTIQKGKTATLVSLIAVFVFMAVFYRFCGIVSCLALAANLLFVFAVMILLNAPLTLPGVAGLALTVGMAVDSNVLIFERLREEMARGTGLRMAIRNGFDRATTTIVDSNLTTIITAVVLYVIGTDQLRGFAVTLTLGLLMSMFTAVFCSRVIFDIAERRGWIKDLKMMRLLGTTNIDFIGKSGIAVAGSTLLIVIGMVTVVVRGESILDIDLTGGVSVTMVLEDSMPPDQVRSRLGDHFKATKPPVTCTVNTVGVEGRPEDSVYKIDANLTAAEQLEGAIEEAFRDSGGKSMLLAYAMSFGDVKPLAKPAPTPPATDNAAAAGAPATPAAGSGAEETAPNPEAQPPAEEVTSVAHVTFENAINAPTLREAITSAYSQIHPLSKPTADAGTTPAETPQVNVPDLFVDTDEIFDWDQSSAASNKEWYVRMTATPEQISAVLERMEDNLSNTPVFLSSSTVGGQVAGDSRKLAVAALMASWVGIIIYVWVRFQNLIFGVAAVIALIHDVLVTVTAIALSAYLTGFLGFLLVDDFRINLTMVAALLTIIGYSINDTIVIYDRVREVRGRSPKITGEMINLSINQTLSRTVLTAWTVLLVTLILYIFGGSGIHGFAFAMTVGTITGAYSTVYIAAPIVLWMLRKETKKPAAE